MGTAARRMIRMTLPLALVAALCGCSGGVLSVGGGSSGSGSRATLYNSLSELIADSGAVVVGTVVARGPGPMGTTVLTVAVERTFTPQGLGTTSRETTVQVPPDSSVLVRTYEDTNTSATPAGLEQGSAYLLFLAPTGLASAKPNEFFVTGAVAGIYEQQGEQYVRKVIDADRLPASITADDLSGR
jgi:hypothetical protein